MTEYQRTACFERRPKTTKDHHPRPRKSSVIVLCALSFVIAVVPVPSAAAEAPILWPSSSSFVNTVSSVVPNPNIITDQQSRLHNRQPLVQSFVVVSVFVSRLFFLNTIVAKSLSFCCCQRQNAKERAAQSWFTIVVVRSFMDTTEKPQQFGRCQPKQPTSRLI